MPEHPPRAISVVGIMGETFGPAAQHALAGATVLVGSTRQLALAAPSKSPSAEHIVMQGPLPDVFDAVGDRLSAGERVCILASGDPGFFGIVGALSERFGPGRIDVHPAPSSLSMAFARIGLPWDDATVVSVHGRPLEEALARAAGPKVAVLTSPDNPPQAVGATLMRRGWGPRQAYVVSRIGEAGESCIRTDVESLATGEFDPLSVVVVLDPDRPGHQAPLGWEGAAHQPPLSWGLPEAAFEHRAGMITKAEVRAVALSKLALPESGVLWDVGAGSGSVGIECARLRPGLRVIAIEQAPDDARRITTNATSHGVALKVVNSPAPAAFDSLPDPDRVFVGGGGIEVLDAAMARLRAGGVVVASYALVERAGEAARRLGNLVHLSVARGVPAGDIGTRLSAENPVFLCWGPTAEQ